MLPYYRKDREYESPLNEYRVSAGLTHKELAMLAKVSVGTLTTFANGTISPLYEKKGKEQNSVKVSAERVALALNVSLEDLFPRYFCEMVRAQLVECQYFGMFMSAQSSCGLMAFEDRELVGVLMESLTPRERDVIECLFLKDLSPAEIARKFHVTVFRIRAIQARAMEKIARAVKRERE